jgi:uncharacterized delta-60 repeat protein
VPSNEKILAAAILLFFTLTVRAQAGTFDSTFGTGGVVKTITGPEANTSYELVNKYLLKRTVSCLLSYKLDNGVFLTRRFSDGSLDTTYGNKGVSDLLKLGNPCIAAMQDDESVVLAASSRFFYTGTQSDFRLMRINKHGALDSTFGVNGLVATDFGYESDMPASITLQPDSKIIVAGSSSHNTNTDAVFALARICRWHLDNTFGIEGK